MLTEKERRIVALKREGKTVREIAELTNSSFSTINDTWIKAEEEEKREAEKKVKLEEQREASDKYTQALALFSQRKSNIEVATSTGLRADEVISIKRDYWKLIRADELALLYEQNRRHLLSIIELDKRIREEDITDDDIIHALEHIREFRSLGDRIERRRDRLTRLNQVIFKARQEISSLIRRREGVERRIDRLKQQESEYNRKFDSYKKFQAIDADLEELK
jgi:transposase